MQTLEPILIAHPFFQGLAADDLRLLVGCASNVRFVPDEVIAREGNLANRFYLIREGKVALELFVPERGSVMMATVGAGEILGWSWLVPPFIWRFDARAIEMTRAIALDGECLRAKCDANPRLGYELLKRVAGVFADRLSATRLQLLDVYGKQP
jgi:CRP/FNR family transcriptional regulator, cyclic AMP receptor protein